MSLARDIGRKSFGEPRVARFDVVLCTLLLTAGLAVTQILIGGRGLVFSFPGYVLIAIGAVVAAITFPRAKTRADYFCLGTSAVFFSYILIRAITSPQIYAARADLYCVLAALCVYGLTLLLGNSNVRLTVILLLLFLAVVHVLIGIVQFTRGDNFMLIPFLQRADYDRRASGFYVCPNHLAGLLEVLGIFALSITCWSRWPLWSKLLIGYLACVCYAGLVLTGSRGGYLSVMASLVVFALLSISVLASAGKEFVLKFGLAGLLASACVLAAGAYLFHSSTFLTERAGSIVDTKNMRPHLWKAAIEQWKLQPLTGTGSGTYRFYGRLFRDESVQNDPVDVHNDYLHLLCEYGAVGGAAFLFFLYAHLRHGLRSFARVGPKRVTGVGSPLSNRLALNIGALCAVAALIVHSVVDFNLHIPANALLLAFVFGLIANPDLKSSAPTARPAQSFFSRVVLGMLGLILLVQSLRLFPGEYYGEHARTALRDEHPALAISLARTALHYEQQNPEIFFYFARALLAVAQRSERKEERSFYYDEALTAFSQARALAPLDGTYPLEIAYLYDTMHRFPEAEKMYAEAKARDPRSMAIAQLYQAHLESLQKLTEAKTPKPTSPDK